MNGTSWSKIGGGGKRTTGTIYALAVYNGNLYVGGEFTSMYGTSNTNNIAEWNGTSWVALGTGVTGGTGIVKSLAVLNGDLYAGGNFTTAGGNTASDIAEWNGTSWSALPQAQMERSTQCNL